MAKGKTLINRPIAIPRYAEQAMKICWEEGIRLFPEPVDRSAKMYYIRHEGLKRKWWPELRVYSTKPRKATEVSLFEAMYALYIEIATKIYNEQWHEK